MQLRGADLGDWLGGGGELLLYLHHGRSRPDGRLRDCGGVRQGAARGAPPRLTIVGRPATLLEGLSGHALALGAGSIDVEYQDGREWVYANFGDRAISIANYKSSSSDAKELRENLYAAARRPVRALLNGQAVLVKVRISQNFGEDSFAVTFVLVVPRADSGGKPAFTRRQGQFLAFIHYDSKIHRRAPAETDLQEYFRVSAPSVHEILKTLQRNGLIERTPGQARSTRLLVRPEDLPELE